MHIAGVKKVYIVLRKGKWDIPNYFGDGHEQDIHLAYLIMRHPHGVPYTLDQAYPFIKSSTILFGFPDILFYPKNAYVTLLNQLSESGADIALGVFKVTCNHEKMDLLEMDAQDRIRKIEIKPKQTRLSHTWIAAAWTPAFTSFMHECIVRDAHTIGQNGMVNNVLHKELHMGDVINIALESNIKTTFVRFDSGCFLDIGTPEDLYIAADFVQSCENSHESER
jgi:glucose-1-phosphate thymidylyltransferase